MGFNIHDQGTGRAVVNNRNLCAESLMLDV
jgi:hypothetical protein